jgi:hypothetical protein
MMALGEFQFYIRKSRAKEREEDAAYASWAFPRGEDQREHVQSLLLELFPNESVPTTLIPFLTCKELFDQSVKAFGFDHTAHHLVCDVVKYKRIIRKEDMPTYVALVLADHAAEKSHVYPTADAIRAKAAELTVLRAKNHNEY